MLASDAANRAAIRRRLSGAMMMSLSDTTITSGLANGRMLMTLLALKLGPYTAGLTTTSISRWGCCAFSSYAIVSAESVGERTPKMTCSGAGKSWLQKDRRASRSRGSSPQSGFSTVIDGTGADGTDADRSRVFDGRRATHQIASRR